MSWWPWLLIGVVVTIYVYAAFVLSLLLGGRRQDARALALFISDCVVLFRRLLSDDRVPFAAAKGAAPRASNRSQAIVDARPVAGVVP
jgi:hypothetical protein